MSKTAVVTTRLDAETFSGLAIVAERNDRSRAWIVAEAVKQYVRQENAFLAFLQEGEDAIDRGEVYTRDEMEALFNAKKAARAAKI